MVSGPLTHRALLAALLTLCPAIAHATLAAPADLAATALSSSSISLGWSYGDPSATGFAVERSLKPRTGFKRIATIPATVRGYQNDGLASATTYYYRVKAMRGGTSSRRSKVASATTAPVAPAETATPTTTVTATPTRTATATPARTATPTATPTPTADTIAPQIPASLSATATSCSQVSLAWGAATDSGGSGLEGYRVYRNGGFLVEVLAPATSTTDAGLAAATVYAYTVRALDHAGNLSATSNTASTNTPTCPNKPPVADAGSDQAGTVGVAVMLNGAGSSDPDGTISSYAWTFGDGASATGASVSHTYATAGSYTATLTVTDNAGAQASDTAAISITSASVWSHGFGGPGDDRGLSVAVDAGGNVAMTGYFSGTVDFGGGPFTSEHFPWLDANQYRDVIVAKYSPTGSHLWSRRIGAEADDRGYQVAMDGGGAVVVAGSVASYADLGNGTQTSAQGGSDAFVAEYAATDGAYVWSHSFGGSGEDSARAVAVDGAGNVFAVGHFQGTVDFGGGSLTCAGGSTDQDLFVVKYSPTGAHLWSKRFGGASAFDYGYGVAVDSGGNVIVTGAFYGTVSFGGVPLTSAGGYDAFLAAFSPTGTYLWSKRLGGNADDYGYAVAVDATGNVVVTGSFQGSADFSGGTLASAGGTDVFVARYSSTGAHLWSRRAGGTAADGAQGVAVDATGNVVVTGSFQGSADFGGGVLTSIGGGDLFVAAYAAADGAHLWSRRFGGSGYQYGQSVAVDASGKVLATGYFQGTVDFGDGTLSSAGASDIFLARLVP